MCEYCNHQLDYLDTICHKVSKECFELFICHNEDCEMFGAIYNNMRGHLESGDPSDLY